MNDPLSLARWKNTYSVIMPERPGKDVKSRLAYFIDWMARTSRPWYQPDLLAYRDFLLQERCKIDPLTGTEIPAPLSASSAQAHLSTIRARYQALLRDNALRDHLYQFVPPGTGPADRKALVDEVLTRLQNAIHPGRAPISTILTQDDADRDHLRLTPEQVRALLRTPGINNLPGLRNTAMLSTMVCTGVREAELVALDVGDLRQTVGGELALLVREGKGGKQRLVPYGPLDWCLVYVSRWLKSATIHHGPVFRGFYKGYHKVRPSRLTTRAVNLIMNQLPITINGELRTVTPHDLRRTYARNAFEQGMDMERIRQNLGHASVQTTQQYIGALETRQRRPPDMFSPPHRLEELLDDRLSLMSGNDP
jgi:integrase